MDYDSLINEVSTYDFIRDRDMADASVKAVLGIFASRLHEDEARHFTERLPEPLTYGKLHSHQRSPVNISFDQYISEIAQQFDLSYDQAKMLISEVLHDTKMEITGETITEVERDLPDDWSSFFHYI